MIDVKLLRPTTYGQLNPFATTMQTLESKIREHHPDYIPLWEKLIKLYIRRILKLGKTGASIRSLLGKSPNYELKSILSDIYEIIDNCEYYTSHIWRAYSYWLTTQKYNPRWPQADEQEIHYIDNLLTEEERAIVRVKASEIWVNVFDDPEGINKLMKQIEPTIKGLCYKRAGLLASYDAALYSFEDLYQEIYCSVLTMIRKNDTFHDNPMKMVSWVIKCADNIIHNITGKVIKSSPKMIHTSTMEEKDDFNLDDLLRIEHQGQFFQEMKEMEDSIQLTELIAKADPKISIYLRTVCGGEHNTDFWTWFYHHEPILAQREAYLEEHPEALGPYVQRHLALPTWELTSFLNQYLPDLMTKVSNTPRNRKLIKGVA
jgi:DNA-directed RNA polymerase specialized sigma24 family protein